MGSFGDRLQREREMRGITLEEIAEATKIGTRSLRALEQQEFDKLPGGIFNKGFVRAYSRYLGLDEEQAVADYLAAIGEAQGAAKQVRADAGAAQPDRNIRIVEAEEPQPIRLPWRLIATVVLVIAAAAGWKYVSRHGIPKLGRVKAAGQALRVTAPSAPAPVSSPQTAPATTETAPGEAQISAAAADVPGDGFLLKIRAREQSWVSVMADGKPAPSELMPAGSEKSIRAQRSVVLKTGNAAGIELYQNDKLLPPLGTGSQVKTVTITPEGMKSPE